MIDHLAKMFIKNHKDLNSDDTRTAYGYLLSFVGIFLNIILFIIKNIAGVLSGSVAIEADAFNNLSDAGSSIISLIGCKLASQKPDSEHPYGHGRYEYIAALVIASIIVSIGVRFAIDSINKIITPSQIEYSWLIFAILAISILVKIYMYYYNMKLSRKFCSPIMKAVAADSASDALSTGTVLISSIVSKALNVQIDGFVGLFVAIVIFKSGINNIVDTVNSLVGTNPDKEIVERIEKIIKSHGEILGLHDLMTHNYGPKRIFASVHIEIPADWTIIDAHDLADKIEDEVLKETDCNLTIHIDPVDLRDSDRKAALNTLGKVIKEIDANLTYHDFRIEKHGEYTDLIFDLVIPYHYKLSDEEIREKVRAGVKAENSGYNPIFVIDKETLWRFCKDISSHEALGKISAEI